MLLFGPSLTVEPLQATTFDSAGRWITPPTPDQDLLRIALVDVDTLACLDYLAWLRTGEEVAKRLNVN